MKLTGDINDNSIILNTESPRKRPNIKKPKTYHSYFDKIFNAK